MALLGEVEPGAAERRWRSCEPAFHVSSERGAVRPAQEQLNVEPVLRPSGIELEKDEVCGLDHRQRQTAETKGLSPVEDSRLPRPFSDHDVDGRLSALRDTNDARERVFRVSSPDLDLGAGIADRIPGRGREEALIQDQNVEILGRAADTVRRKRHPADESRPRATRLERFEDAGEKRSLHGPSLDWE